MAKRILRIFLCMTLCIGMSALRVHGEQGFSGTLRTIYATFLKETVEVSRKVMEIDGSTAEPVHINAVMSGDTSGYVYKVIQYDGKTEKTITSSSSKELDIYPDQCKTGIPLYLSVCDASGNTIFTRLMNLRINTGEAEKRSPVSIGSEFGSGFVIDMSSFLPGMSFNVLPFAIPVTAKSYADGRYVLGIGMNSSDMEFWTDAAAGTLPTHPDAGRLRAAFSQNKGAFSGGAMGWSMVVSGYVQGNVNTVEPLRGKMSMYIGSGLDYVGQYSILTFEVTATGGAEGEFEFSFVWDPDESKYNFQPDKFQTGWKAGLELFGGLGLARVFTAGIYGSGSLAAHSEFYPEANVDQLILAGETGFKVKFLGKNILVYKLISGSTDFIHKKNDAAALLVLSSHPSVFNTYLLDNDYAAVKTEADEPDEETVWHGGKLKSEEEIVRAYLKSGKTDGPDFSQLVAENIYPDNHIQFVHTGSEALPKMNAVFLGNDISRENGNRSRLMNFYYNLPTEFISDPDWIDFDGRDDETPDFNPHAYHDSIHNKTYLVYENASEKLDADASLSEMAAVTDICFAEYQAGNDWQSFAKITDYSSDNKDIYATGARVSSEEKGDPVISWYLNTVSDPAGLDYEGTHEIYLARKDNKDKWSSEKAAEITGSILEVNNAYFHNGQTAAVSYVIDEGETNRIELWQNGEKIWEREKALCGRFVFEGFENRLFTWYEEGALWSMDESLKEIRMTPEDFIIPSADYQIYGKFGSSSVILLGTSSKEASGNLWAILSSDGGDTWRRVSLTDVEAYSSVSFAGCAFTYEDEPVILYSVQNYDITYNPESTDAQALLDSGAKIKDNLIGNDRILVGAEDERFNDTHTDLYIKARKANSHVRIANAAFTDWQNAAPRHSTPVELTVENTGLYDIDSLVIFQEGIPVETVEADLKPGESAEFTTELMVTADGSASEPMPAHIGISSKGDSAAESSCTAYLPTGFISTTIDHLFLGGEESLQYSITNHGFNRQTVTIVVRDDENSRILEEKTLTVSSQVTVTDSYKSPSGMFTKDSINKISIYILQGDETIESESVTSDRRLTVACLDDIYGQDYTGLNKRTDNGSRPAETPESQEYVPAVPVIRPTAKPAEIDVVTPETVSPEPQKTEAPVIEDETETPEPESGTVPYVPAEETAKGKASALPWAIGGIIVTAAVLIALILWFDQRKKKE